MKIFDKKAFTLAEGATHVDKFNNKRKFGFTLAEVLITLGIIGVVAVLTVPNLVSNYQKKVYVAQLQKAYAQLQQVFDMAMADDEVEYLADTELLQSINGDMIYDDNDQTAFSLKLGQYMKIQKVCQPMDFSDGCHNVFYENLDPTFGPDAGTKSNRGRNLQVFSKDGMIYYFHDGFHKNVSVYGDEFISCQDHLNQGFASCAWHSTNTSPIMIDVNGKKGPNKYGRDMFSFTLDDKGQVFPVGSKSTGDSWEISESMCNTRNAYGNGCAGRIMDSGWVMDY